jgi:2-polyprenyl-3-methyl-5-hydroxy-6-metoxy-1,4-benzoquinol methylase
MVVTLACRALRRVGFCASNSGSMSRLALRIPLLRAARPACGVFILDGGCGVGVLRRLADRTPLRSAMVNTVDASDIMVVHAV